MIAFNEFCGIGAIVLLNEKRNGCGSAEAQYRLIDHAELNSILKVLMSCLYFIQNCVCVGQRWADESQKYLEVKII